MKRGLLGVTILSLPSPLFAFEVVEGPAGGCDVEPPADGRVYRVKDGKRKFIEFPDPRLREIDYHYQLEKFYGESLSTKRKPQATRQTSRFGTSPGIIQLGPVRRDDRRSPANRFPTNRRRRLEENALRSRRPALPGER